MRGSNNRLRRLENTVLGPATHIAVDLTCAEADALSDEERLAIIAEARRRAGEHGKVIVLCWNADLAEPGDRIVRLKWPEDE